MIKIMEEMEKDREELERLLKELVESKRRENIKEIKGKILRGLDRSVKSLIESIKEESR